jgi:hypothetical protein
VVKAQYTPNENSKIKLSDGFKRLYAFCLKLKPSNQWTHRLPSQSFVSKANLKSTQTKLDLEPDRGEVYYLHQASIGKKERVNHT